jgi:TRAP-type C4-dicarboxylate transport system permease small subunit
MKLGRQGLEVRSFERLLRAIEHLSERLTVILMLATMLIVFADVMLRHFFGQPLSWAYDLIGMYLLTGIYFFSLSSSYASHAHVGVDLIIRNLSDRYRRLSEILTSLLGIALFAQISYTAFERSVESLINQEVVSGLIPWPTWVSPALVSFGSALLVLRLAYRFFGNSISLLSGRSVVAPLPISGARLSE